MSSLELPDILDETARFTQWYELGVYLKLPTEELDDIEKKFSANHGSKRCKIELFKLWMKTNRDASWEQLARALEKCGEKVLADGIRRRHAPSAATADSQPSKAAEPSNAPRHEQQSVPASCDQQQTSTDSTPASPAPVQILVGEDRVKQFTRLERDFASLVSELLSALEKDVSLVELRRFLNERLRNEDLLQASSIDEVFRLIRPHYCFLNTTILEDIIANFLGEPLKQKMEKYENQLDEFIKFTELSVLMGVGSNLLSSIEMPRVVLKMGGLRNLLDITIKRFQGLVRQIFKKESSALANICVEDGCICVSWFARRSAVPALVTLAQENVKFMQHIGVLGLSVGDTIILDPKQEKEEDCDLHSLLLRATTADCAQAVEFLLSIEADPNCTSENGDTTLIIACRNESISIANMLLTARADVNLENKQGCTALIMVCCAEVPNKSLVRMLVQAGAEVNIPSGEIQVSFPDKDMVQVTALMLAARGGHTNIVRYLLNEGADVNKLDAHGSSALMYASSRGHTETVHLLLNYGANVNAQMTADGRTALMFASYGHNETVHLLLSHDATVNTQDEYGITALLIAACNGFAEIVHLLLNYGADVSIQDKGNNTVLHYACGRQRTECVEFLLATGADPNIQDAHGDTPLIFACRMKGDARDPAILVMLLSVGANPNIQTGNGATALMFAAGTSYQEGVEILLNAGASVNLWDSDGHTALHDAAQEGNLEIVELLLASGAQASVSGNDGVTPLDLALDGGHDDVCQLLITSMESDPLTSQQLEARQSEIFQQSSNPAPPTTQDTHSSEHPQHQPHRSAVQTTRTRLNHARSLSTIHHYIENILLPDRAIKRRDEADNNCKQDSNTSKSNN